MAVNPLYGNIPRWPPSYQQLPLPLPQYYQQLRLPFGQALGPGGQPLPYQQLRLPFGQAQPGQLGPGLSHLQAALDAHLSGDPVRGELHRLMAEQHFGVGNTVPSEVVPATAQMGPYQWHGLPDAQGRPFMFGQKGQAPPEFGEKLGFNQSLEGSGERIPLAPTVDMYGKQFAPMSPVSPNVRVLPPTASTAEQLATQVAPEMGALSRPLSGLELALGRGVTGAARAAPGAIGAMLLPQVINQLPVNRTAKDFLGNVAAGGSLGSMGFALGPEVGVPLTVAGAAAGGLKDLLGF